LLQIDVDTTEHGSRAAVRVSGDLDLLAAERLSTRLAALIEALADGDGAVQLDVDLAGVRFCDAAGLNALLHVDRLLSDRRGHLVIRHPCRSLRVMTQKLNGFGRLDFAQE
jgi:anti-anti-sigma factor